MSALPDNGGPAFPCDNKLTTKQGMTVRDWFAGQAMNGVLLAPGDVGDNAQCNPKQAALWAYEYADAMLAARSSAKGTA